MGAVDIIGGIAPSGSAAVLAVLPFEHCPGRCAHETGPETRPRHLVGRRTRVDRCNRACYLCLCDQEEAGKKNESKAVFQVIGF